MNFIVLLQQHMILTSILAGVLGLIIGSFLNVVIVRYPIMLERQWQTECREFLHLKAKPKTAPFNLLIPRSHCPSCKKNLNIWHNIPVFSFICLKGKCAFCKARISILYPIIELISAITTIIVILLMGLTWPALAVLIFTWGLIVLSTIDIQHQLLPDIITFSLLWLGLLVNTQYFFTTPTAAIWGALIGYLLLWCVAKLFKLIRKKEGMGHGDFKMLSMLGAWLGVEMLLNTILIAAFVGLIVSLALILTKKISHQHPVPFGPFLALGGWLTLMLQIVN